MECVYFGGHVEFCMGLVWKGVWDDYIKLLLQRSDRSEYDEVTSPRPSACHILRELRGAEDFSVPDLPSADQEIQDGCQRKHIPSVDKVST